MKRLPWLAAIAAMVLSARAHAEPLAFAVVNLSGSDLPATVVQEAEREYARLRPGVAAITDAGLRRLLATGETTAAAVSRLVEEARSKRSLGACVEALPLAAGAEDLALNGLPPDEAREPLKAIYTLMGAGGDNVGRTVERDQAARRLRALVALPPDDLPPGLWESCVSKAVAGPATVELQVDSEPPNAQIILNFHAVGSTPTTLKMPAGEVLIELQKEGYKKGFRRLELHRRAERTVLRLTDVKRDRTELVTSAMTTLASKDEVRNNLRLLEQLAQWTRADALVLLRAAGDRVSIEFFDAERGQVAQEHLFSHYDRDTGRIEVLAQKPTPGGSEPLASGSRAGILAPVNNDATTTGPAVSIANEPDNEDALSQTYKTPYDERRGPPNRGHGPWWGWLIAAAVAGTIGALVYADQPRTNPKIDVNARF